MAVLPVLKGISLHVRAGEVVTLIGGNGAGKTTTLRTISGLLPPRKGAIEFAGQDLTRMPAERIVTLGLALVPEGRRVFRTLSVTANLELGAYHRRDKSEVRRDLEEMRAALSHPQGAGPPGRGHPFRRRAADPGHRPGPHGPPPPLDAGRAFHGAGPPDGHPGLRYPGGTQGRRAPPSSWWNRTPGRL